MVGIENAPVDGLFEGSNGQYYTDWEVRRHLRRGAWRVCLRQRNPDRRLVEIEDERLLMLTPVDASELPGWVEIRVIGDIARIVDTRHIRRTISTTRF